MKLTVIEPTWLKKIDAQAADIKESGDKFALQKGQELNALAFRKISSNVALCTLDRGYGLLGFNTWYLFTPHFEYELKSQSTEGKFTLLPGQTDTYGAQLYLFECAGHQITCISGAIGSMPCHPSEDFPGSYRPIPEGLYTVGVPQHDERFAVHGDAIGPDWIDLFPTTYIGGRSGILAHRDYNWQSSPGTAGCIAPIRHRDMDILIDLAASRQWRTLRVSYGYGVV